MKNKLSKTHLACSLLLYTILVISIFISGCKAKYGAGNPFGDKIYFAKNPDKSGSKTGFIGGNISYTTDSASYNEKESNYNGSIYFGSSYNMKVIQLSIGAFAYNGKYKVKKITEHEGKKSYYGAGISSEIATLFLNTGNMYSYSCLKGTLTYEDGPFYRFRKNAENDSLITNLNPSKYSLNLSIGDDFLFQFGELQTGLYTSVGLNYNIPLNEKYLLLTLCGHITYQNISFYSQLTYSQISVGTTLWFGISRQFGGGG